MLTTAQETLQMILKVATVATFPLQPAVPGGHGVKFSSHALALQTGPQLLLTIAVTAQAGLNRIHCVWQTHGNSPRFSL